MGRGRATPKHVEERIVYVLKTTDLNLTMVGVRFGVSLCKVRDLAIKHKCRKWGGSEEKRLA